MAMLSWMSRSELLRGNELATAARGDAAATGADAAAAIAAELGRRFPWPSPSCPNGSMLSAAEFLVLLLAAMPIGSALIGSLPWGCRAACGFTVGQDESK